MRRVGLCGAGFIAPFHLRAWQAAGCNVVALADPDAERARQRAGEFSIDGVFASVAQMLETADLDLLDVASPRRFHVEHVLAGLQRDLPVIVQKPLAPTLAEARELAGRIGPQHRVMVHENWRFRPDYRQIRDWIRAGRLGRLTFVNMEMRSTALVKGADGSRPAGLRQPFMLEERRLALAEVLIHNIDTVRCLVGDLELLSATLSHGDRDLPGETAAILSLRGEAGVPVTISGDMMAAGAPPRATDRLEIIGTDGRVLLEGPLLAGHLADGPRSVSYEGRDMLQEAATATVRHFVDCLADDRPFETAVPDNLKTLQIVEQAYRLHGAG